MAEFFCIKRTGPVLTPASEEDKLVIDKMPNGSTVKLKFTRSRNIKFHRKWFSLARFAYDYWEPTPLPDPKYKNVVPEKDFDRFRKDLIILAGYYDATYRMNGETRIEAKSIAFDNMDEDEFEKLFQKTIQVVLNHICKNLSEEELNNAVDAALNYAT